jgi:hypothetical protein
MVHATIDIPPETGWGWWWSGSYESSGKERRNGTVVLACFEGKLLGGVRRSATALDQGQERPILTNVVHEQAKWNCKRW